MLRKIRKRKIKYYYKIATQGPDLMERDEGSMSLSEQMQQSFKSENNYRISEQSLCDWNDSMILDFVGIVPFAGDTLDVGRGIVYIECGKYFDGFITLICAAPVVGAAGVAVKAARKYSTKVDGLFKFVSDIAEYLGRSFLDIF